MGVRGPVPQPGRDNRERHYRFTKIPAVPNLVPAPALRLGHTDKGLELWADWWATPMSTMWGPFDADALERLLLMYEQSWAQDPDLKPAAGEIRQLEDRFGLTPSARARLGWQVEGVDIPATEPDRLGHPEEDGGRAVPAAGGKSDPRLRVVS